jgi:hypothetical protein
LCTLQDAGITLIAVRYSDDFDTALVDKRLCTPAFKSLSLCKMTTRVN